MKQKTHTLPPEVVAVIAPIWPRFMQETRRLAALAESRRAARTTERKAA